MMYEFPRVPTFGPGLAAQMGATEHHPLPVGVKRKPHIMVGDDDKADKQ